MKYSVMSNVNKFKVLFQETALTDTLVYAKLILIIVNRGELD